MLKKVLNNLDFSISKDEEREFNKYAKEISELIKKELKNAKIRAEVFIGGSFARGTLVKSNSYDIDIFVRFDKKYKEISEILEKIIKNTKKKYKRVHGSRDYFQISQGKHLVFDIIPVLKIKNPKEAENVTDLSYFHVKYVKNRLKDKKLANQVKIAKVFLNAQGVYGAESYIKGISGYGVECLIIYYKTFEKIARELSKVKAQLIIDPDKKFKNKEEIKIVLNENKLEGPIVLIDPTWKERNVLASLSQKTFTKLQDALKRFIAKPSASFFSKKEIDEKILENKAKKNKEEMIKIILHTDKQAGDIAGTKLKKFYEFLLEEIGKKYNIYESHFDYNDEDSARIYFVGKSKGEIIKRGPPTNMENHVKAFKKENKKTFIKNNQMFARIKIIQSLKEVLIEFKAKNKKKIEEMDITEMKIG